jgi:hypothetical protein
MRERDTVIEQYDRLDGTVGQTVQRADGTEYERVLRFAVIQGGRQESTERAQWPGGIDDLPF